MQKKTINKIKSIKGVGFASISKMRFLLGANLRKASEFTLSYNGIIRIKKFLRVQKTTSLLEAIITKRVNNHITIKSYKGLRHKNGYPVRGQRTRTNGNTAKKKLSIAAAKHLEGPPLDAYPFGGIVKYEGKKSQPLKGGDDADENDNFFGGVVDSCVSVQLVTVFLVGELLSVLVW